MAEDDAARAAALKAEGAAVWRRARGAAAPAARRALYGEAAEKFSQAAERAPADAALWSNLSAALCARGDPRKGDAARALGAARRAVDLRPDWGKVGDL